MTTRKLLTTGAIISLGISLPFVVLHLVARPDDAPISPFQHVTAAFANFFGPWGVAIVRLVDFPNAGLRSFSWLAAIGLTLLGALIVLVAVRTEKRYTQDACIACWTVLTAVWFVIGLFQIASGLL